VAPAIWCQLVAIAVCLLGRRSGLQWSGVCQPLCLWCHRVRMPQLQMSLGRWHRPCPGCHLVSDQQLCAATKGVPWCMTASACCLGALCRQHLHGKPCCSLCMYMLQVPATVCAPCYCLCLAGCRRVARGAVPTCQRRRRPWVVPNRRSGCLGSASSCGGGVAVWPAPKDLVCASAAL
jgi:hypothetical protein